jgi:hypothetical protein
MKKLLALLFVLAAFAHTQLTAQSYMSSTFIWNPADAGQMATYDSLGHLGTGGTVASGTFHALYLDTLIRKPATALAQPLRIDSTGQIVVVDSCLQYCWPDSTNAEDKSVITFHHGSLSWQVPSGGGNAWLTTGNAGTDSKNNFIGAIDSQIVYIISWDNNFKNTGSEAASIFLDANPLSGSANTTLELNSNDSANNGYSSINLLAGNDQWTTSNWPQDSASFLFKTDSSLTISFQQTTGLVSILGQFQLNNGTQGAGKVLTSDASGNASWQAISTWLTNNYASLPKYASDAAAGVGGLITGNPYVSSVTFALTFKQ